MDRHLVLYTGTLCHLCDRAKAVLFAAIPEGVGFREIDIDSDTGLTARYGFTIPVVAVIREDGSTVIEKNWPFTAGQIKRILAQYFTE